MTLTQFVIPEKIRKVMMKMPIEKLLLSHTHFLGLRFSDDHGDESDFREYQNYVPGEDPKRIDWKVYARSNVRVVKKFSSEKSRSVYLVLDSSASMGDEGCRHFLETFYYLAAYLCFKDEVFAMASLGEQKTQWIKSGSGMSQIRKVESTLSGLNFSGTSWLTEPFLKMMGTLDRSAEILYFSDLQNPVSELNRIAEVVNYQKIHLTMVGLFNHRAYEPIPNHANSRGSWLQDEETGLRKFIGRKLIKEYQQEMVHHYRQIEDLSRKKNFRYIQIDSREDGLQGFLKLFQ